MKKTLIAGIGGLALLLGTTGCLPLEELSKATTPAPAPVDSGNGNVLGLPAIVNPTGVKTENEQQGGAAVASNPALNLSWNGANLVVQGSGFAGGETVRLAIKATSKQETKVQRPGVFSVSSGASSSNISTMAKAKADGTLRLESMLLMPAGSEVVVSASGDKGSSAEARTETPAR